MMSTQFLRHPNFNTASHMKCNDERAYLLSSSYRKKIIEIAFRFFFSTTSSQGINKQFRSQLLFQFTLEMSMMILFSDEVIPMHDLVVQVFFSKEAQQFSSMIICIAR